MPRRTNARRVLADQQSLLADPVQQGGMSGRVGNVDTAGEDRNGAAVARQRCPVRGPVDAERAARHHRNVARCQSRRDVRRDMLAVGRRRARADDGRGPAGHVVQPGRADRPQH